MYHMLQDKYFRLASPEGELRLKCVMTEVRGELEAVRQIIMQDVVSNQPESPCRVFVGAQTFADLFSAFDALPNFRDEHVRPMLYALERAIQVDPLKGLRMKLHYQASVNGSRAYWVLSIDAFGRERYSWEHLPDTALTPEELTIRQADRAWQRHIDQAPDTMQKEPGG